MADPMLKICLNPLMFPEVAIGVSIGKLDAESALRFLCAPDIDSSLDQIANRYNEITNQGPPFFAAPAEPRILNKLVWPLRHAKCSYMLGNFLGTISLAGMVSEMVALLIFDIQSPNLKGAPITDADQAKLFGSKFEKLSQDRRVQVLEAYDLIDGGLKIAFDDIRITRRKYLHLWSQDHDTVAGDARTVFRSAVTLVASVLCQDVANNRLSLPRNVYDYLRRHGVTNDLDEQSET